MTTAFEMHSELLFCSLQPSLERVWRWTRTRLWLSCRHGPIPWQTTQIMVVAAVLQATTELIRTTRVPLGVSTTKRICLWTASWEPIHPSNDSKTGLTRCRRARKPHHLKSKQLHTQITALVTVMTYSNKLHCRFTERTTMMDTKTKSLKIMMRISKTTNRKRLQRSQPTSSPLPQPNKQK